MENRRRFLGQISAGAAALLGLACERPSAKPQRDTRGAAMSDPKAKPEQGRMPVIFAGHGSPMNVIEDNPWSRGFTALSSLAPRPSAILAISAHWYTDGTFLTADTSPKTIHDFGGFPAALYEVQYRAPGKADLARRVRQLLGGERASLSTDWGLDHGTWSVLRWMYPEADIPVVQMSLDRRLDAKAHFALGQSLVELRHEGVLILGSGNVVHNLRDAFGRMRSGDHGTPEWARTYDLAVKRAAEAHDAAALQSLWPEHEHGRLAHPTPDHWWPLLYAAAASGADDAVRFPTEGFDLGSISMRNVVWG